MENFQSRWHQGRVCPSSFVLIPTKDGCNLCEYFRWYDIPFRTLIHNSLLPHPPRGLARYPTLPLFPPPLFFGLSGKPVKIVPPLKISATQQPEIPTPPTRCAFLHGKSGKNMMGHKKKNGKLRAGKWTSGGLDGSDFKTCWHANSPRRCHRKSTCVWSNGRCQ